MLTRYIETAMKHARYKWLTEEDGYYGEIPELPGVWPTGSTEQACSEELQEVSEERIGSPLDWRCTMISRPSTA